MVIDLTGLPVANASLLDEGTAAAEAMHLFQALAKPGHDAFFVSDKVHPQTLEVVRTRAVAWHPGGGRRRPHLRLLDPDLRRAGAVPGDRRAGRGPRPSSNRVHAEGAYAAVATDLLALTVLTPPGELGGRRGGSAQRFGVPMGYGGPHAAFFAVKQEFTRLLPGRIIGVSEDAQGHRALRMALQTREQHIRREKATSNICTAQALLAVMASFYAAWHGPEGLRAIATRVHGLTVRLARGLGRLGVKVKHASVFDTLRLEMEPAEADRAMARARDRKMNLRRIDARSIGISLDETTRPEEVEALWSVLRRRVRRPAGGLCGRGAGLGGDALVGPGAHPGGAATSPTRSSTATTPRPRCSGTSSGWRPGPRR